jgi:hypothetical protein
MARVTLSVTDIDRILSAPPALYTATGSDGFKFDNASGNVFLEVISSTTGQSFTVLTGIVLEEEWTVADDLVNVSNASTTYYHGRYPQNIYNQPDDLNKVYVDHAVGAVLQFRAWKLA